MNNQIIDLHVHFGAPKDEESGCYWSKDFEKTAAYWAMRIITKSLFTKVNIQKVQKKLLKVINKSKHVDKSILLAMDEVYDKSGARHPEWTHLYVPNMYIANLAKENDRILFGASVHPYRKDWSDELDKCIAHKAVLCKWIPSSQQIDPSSDTCTPFYKKLSDHKLPLLCHAGPEYAIPTSNKKYNERNNPKYLRKALDQGVIVIFAHCALPYFGTLDVDYTDDLAEFYKLFKEAERNNWNLYADLSALATPLRAPYIEDILNKIPAERLLFGSDYPIPASELSYTKTKNIMKWIKFVWKMIHLKNPLDKNYHLIRKMGFDDSIFTNAQKLFSSIQY